MKFGRIFAAVSLGICVLFSGCAVEQPRESLPPYELDYTPQYEEGCVTPPFWAVSDEESGGMVFLLGSMHAAKEDVKYPDYILNALYSSEWVAPELDTVEFGSNIPLQRNCVEYLKIKDGNARDLIGDDYQKTVDFLTEKGIYNSAMDMLVPFYWASAANGLVLEESGLDSDFGTESVILRLAKSKKIPVREIEGGEAQYKMMSEIPMSVQLETLSQVIGEENVAGQAETVRELYAAWCGFDEEYFSELSLFDSGEVDNSADWQQYYDMMYTDRQRLMADFIINALEAGERGFVFVGALHFYAEPSIFDYLSERGYTAGKIYPEIQ